MREQIPRLPGIRLVKKGYLEREKSWGAFYEDCSMPDQEFIHSNADVTSTLTYALDSGLSVRLDEPQSEPVPRMLTRPDIAKIERGNFEIFRPDWLYGPF